MKTFKVKIDGQPNTLRFQSYSGSRGYQYLTEGNTSSHAFDQPLKSGERFRTNGHIYEVL